MFDIVARALPEGFATGALPLGVAAVILAKLDASPYLVLWVLTVMVMLVLGLLFGLHYRRRRPSANAPAWRVALHLIVAATGLSWGVAGWLFVPAPWQAELFILTLLTSLSAAVLANIGASLSLYVAYITGAMLPSAIYRVMLGGAMNLALCVGAIAMMVVLTLFASRLASATRRSLRVGHENKRLAQALAQRTAEAEQANLDKSRFIAAASHDLRQPVHALGLLLDVLRGQPLDPRAMHTTERLSTVVHSLEALFTALLDISKLDSGSIEQRPARFAVGPMLMMLVNEFTPAAEAKGLALRWRDTAAWVHSDPILLERMLRNLIANAVRYTAHGGVLVGCRRRGNVLRIEVWDSGRGIAPEDQTSIFNEHYQVDAHGRGADRGLGLGLAIVRRLAALLDHPVDVRSRLGRGSVFRVSVPLVEAAKGLPEPDAAIPPHFDPFASWQGRKVLVVDADQEARAALSSWLSAWGCEVRSFARADAARETMRAQPWQVEVLITDWHPGNGDEGIALSRALRRDHDALCTILLTDVAPDDVRGLGYANDLIVLEKPVRPAMLRAAMAAIWLKPALGRDTSSSVAANVNHAVAYPALAHRNGN